MVSVKELIQRFANVVLAVDYSKAMNSLVGNMILYTIILIQKSIQSAKTLDQITYLPGYGSNLPSKQYSGYFPVGKLSGSQGHLHYWFIESEVSILILSSPVLYLMFSFSYSLEFTVHRSGCIMA